MIDTNAPPSRGSTSRIVQVGSVITKLVVSRQVKRVIPFDVDQAAASSILGSGSASLPAALGMVR